MEHALDIEATHLFDRLEARRVPGRAVPHPAGATATRPSARTAAGHCDPAPFRSSLRDLFDL